MLSDYQKEVDTWISQDPEGYWTPHEILARLIEEVGEVARLINHTYGPKKKKSSETEQNLGDELADVIWTVVCMANRHGINLDDAFQRVVNKSYQRDGERFAKR